MSTIVCGTDLGPSGTLAADLAAVIAKRLRCAVALVHAAPDADGSDAPDAVRPAADALAARVHGVHEALATKLRDEARRLEAAGADVRSARVVSGRPWEVVVAEGVRLGARLVVVGPHAGEGTLRDQLLGSTAEQVIHRAPCPIVVATGTSRDVLAPQREILVGVDGTPTSLAALAVACDLAAVTSARVTVLSVGADAAAAIAEVTPTLACPIVTTAVEGPAAQELCDRARRSDATMIVVGSRGRSAPARFVLGSVSSDVVRGSPVPVLVVRPGGAA